MSRPTLAVLADDRLPPHNILVEESVLGAVFLDPDCLHEIVQLLNVGDFYRDVHRTIYRVVREMYDAGLPIDLLTVSEELRRRDLFDAIGGLDGLSQIANAAPHSANAKYHAQIVKEHALKRSIIEVCNEGLRQGYSREFTSDELLARVETRILAVADASATGDTSCITEGLREALARIERRRQGEMFGVGTGLHDFDELTDGLMPSYLIVLAARPSIGKSSLALNIAEHVVYGAGTPVLYVSLEMKSRELSERLLAGRARIDGHKLRTGADLTAAESARFARAADELLAARDRLFVDDTHARSVSQIAANARRFRARHRVGLIVVDYLQLIAGDGSQQNRQEEVAAISRRLKTLAMELDVPILALSQLNRKAEERDDHKPRMSDLRESGAIEQDADLVLLLHRPDYYDAQDRPGFAEIDIPKNRNGRTGQVKLSFSKQHMRFGEHVPADLVRGPEAPAF